MDSNCLRCGASFRCNASRAKYRRGRYCSPHCAYAARVRKTPTALCAECSCPLTSTSKYCSRRCMYVHLSGSGSPRWRGGHSKMRGSKWEAIRRTIKRRDGAKCRHCGISQQESRAKYGQGLHVHHIKPFHDCESEAAANHPDNLITLCRACHLKTEPKAGHCSRDVHRRRSWNERMSQLQGW